MRLRIIIRLKSFRRKPRREGRWTKWCEGEEGNEEKNEEKNEEEVNHRRSKTSAVADRKEVLFISSYWIQTTEFKLPYSNYCIQLDDNVGVEESSSKKHDKEP